MMEGFNKPTHTRYPAVLTRNLGELPTTCALFPFPALLMCCVLRQHTEVLNKVFSCFSICLELMLPNELLLKDKARERETTDTGKSVSLVMFVSLNFHPMCCGVGVSVAKVGTKLC